MPRNFIPRWEVGALGAKTRIAPRNPAIQLFSSAFDNILEFFNVIWIVRHLYIPQIMLLPKLLTLQLFVLTFF